MSEAEPETPMEGMSPRQSTDPGMKEASAPPRRNLSNFRKLSAPAFSEDLDAALERECETDPQYTKTWSRVFVEKYLENRNWYLPKRRAARSGEDHAEEVPQLSKAWAYYEHFTLARYLVEHGYQRAEPGETAETRLYNPFTTPESSLNEWGLGVGVYFTTLRIMALLLILLGLINIANIVYFQNDDYSDGQSGVTFTLKGSAICTRGEWVACNSCNETSWTSSEEKERFGTDAGGQVFVLRNACDYEDIINQGMVNWASLIVAIVFVGLISLYQRKKETILDEDKLTATDYSILVKNPPKDAIDPDDWNAFFSQFGRVTFVTVALNNGPLLIKLFVRRIWMNDLRRQLPRNIDMEDEDGVRFSAANLERELEALPKGCIITLFNIFVRPFLRLLNMFLAPSVLFEKILKITEEIKELQKKNYDASQVFVTFETEEAQRTAQSALKVVSKLDVITNTARNNVPLFQTSASGTESPGDGTVLRVEEPREPNTIRWQDLHISSMKKLIQRFITFALTVGMVGLAGYLVARVREEAGPQVSAPLVSIFNSVIPVIVKLLMLIENHHHEGTKQQSLYLKITLFRWVNTAILAKIITPFTSTISNGKRDILPTINAILWSELLLVPALRLIDIVSNFKKHILAPRSLTQEQMNSWFQGTGWNLGERYTDFTKVLFLCFFYSALFPGSFFFCGLILLVQYFVDKICLMRIWAPAPFLGTELAKFSRRYFFSAAILTFGLVSSYAWAQFPYDNLCDPEGPQDFVPGSYTILLLSGKEKTVTVQSDVQVEFCSQSWQDYDGIPFPATSRLQEQGLEWMTTSQARLADIYGWSTVPLLIIFVVVVFGGTVIRFLVSFLKGTYKPQGMDMKIDFSTVPEISAYIPQINIRAFPYPLLACDVDDVGHDFVGWSAGTDSLDKHNMIYDVPYEGMKRQRYESPDGTSKKEERPIFSIVKHWPPNWKESASK